MSQTNSPLDAARFWLAAGVATVPLLYRSKKPAVKWTPYRTRLPSLAELEEWYQYPRNLALITGWMNILILDFDSPESFACWYTWQLIHNSQVVQTYQVMSNRGVHVYYYLSDPAHLDSIQGALFEVKTAGKLCTCPPSVHESGRAYQPLSDPAQIRTVKAEEILNYSPITLHAPIVWLPRSKFAPVDTDKSSIETIKESVSLLAFFPTARKLDDHRYLTDCPLHGHRANFWLDTSLGVCGCFAGCNGGRAMNIVQLFATMNNCDVKMAIRELMRMIGG